MKFLRILSLAILAFQIYIPWSVPHFATQDGPSHVYTAFVTKDLVFHRHTSPYHALYFVQKFALPNWTGTLLLAGFLGVFGPDRAEAFVTTVCLLGGYGALAYCAAAFAGRKVEPFLLGNWLVESWFLWAGFYNFCLGMALLMALVGYYARHRVELNWRRAPVLAGGLVLLFFTHLIPAVLAGVALFMMEIWPGSGGRKEWGRPALAIAPTAGLVLLYASRFRGSAFVKSDVREALSHFPDKLFFFRGGWLGEQRFLWPVILCLIVSAILCLRRAEWRTPRGALGDGHLLFREIQIGQGLLRIAFRFLHFGFVGAGIQGVKRLSGTYVSAYLKQAAVNVPIHAAPDIHNIASERLSGIIVKNGNVFRFCFDDADGCGRELRRPFRIAGFGRATDTQEPKRTCDGN